MYSGMADVVPLVASEKNVEACVVSSLFDSVYEDCSATPLLHRRRTSKMNALYQESPSLLFNSIVENAVFCLGVLAGTNGVPSGRNVGSAVLTSLLRSRCFPREPAYPTVTAVRHHSSRCTLTLKTCTRGFSSSN